jgi:tripartite-type tricarboxylate transporter receptor subunit TctC
LAAVFLLTDSLIARAAYPEHPITIVAAYAPGGSSSLAARAFSNAAKRYVDVPVLVQNKAGAGGIIGTDFVYNSQPDGYTLLLGRVATFAVLPAMEKLPYKPMKFTQLGLISTDPYTCVTSSKKPYKNLHDLVQAVKKNPGEITYSSSGTGTLTQIAAADLLSAVGVGDPRTAATHIPYKGEGPAIAAVVGGHVDFFCGNLAPVLQQIQAGNLHALFVTTKNRIPAIKKVPTVYELGYPKLGLIVGWSAIMGPPNMDKSARKRLLDVMRKVKADKKWQTTVRKLGSIPDVKTPEETKIFIRKQDQELRKIVKKLGLQIS